MLSENERVVIACYVSLITIVVLFMLGCGERFIHVEPETVKYIERYSIYKVQYTGKVYNGRVSTYFVNLKDDTAGFCSGDKNGPYILIDREYWDNVTDSDREVLLLHELGHCDLGLGHSHQDTIMEPVLINGFDYLINQGYYLEQLFLEGK